MFSFFRFRGTDDGRSDEDEVPDNKESQENENGSGVGFDDYGNDSFEDVAEPVEKSNGYTVQQRSWIPCAIELRHYPAQFRCSRRRS